MLCAGLLNTTRAPVLAQRSPFCCDIIVNIKIRSHQREYISLWSHSVVQNAARLKAEIVWEP